MGDAPARYVIDLPPITLPTAPGDLIFTFGLIATALVLVLAAIRHRKAIWGWRRYVKLHEKWPLSLLGWFAIPMSVVWLALLVLTIEGLFALWFAPPPAAPDAEGALAYRVHFLAIVGLMTALAGLVGAPLALIRVYTVERQTRNAEQGHITDRISKAVEQLGAEKTVNRIGRSVRIRTGIYTETTHQTPVGREPALLDTSEIISTGRPYDEVSYNEETNEVDKFIAVDHVVGTWSAIQSKIQWQGKEITLLSPEKLLETGDWQVFTETEPNIEVRMGGIFALERIGKDSPADHLQIMEILTAYIRENAPASIAEHPPEPEPKRPDDQSDAEAMSTYLSDLSTYYDLFGPHWEWVQSLTPRNDIQAAITVIGRRSESLRALEITTDADGNTTPIRLDLRGTCLQGVDMSNGYFDHAKFDGARMETCLLENAKLNGASLSKAVLDRAHLSFAELEDAWLDNARLNQVWLNKAVLNRAAIMGAELYGAVLNMAELNYAALDFAILSRAVLTHTAINGATFEGTDFTAAHTRHAAVKSADLSVCVNLSDDQVTSMFGDATTTLPEGMAPPDWHGEELSWQVFQDRREAAKKAAGFG